MLNIVKIISNNIENGRRFLKFLRMGKNDVQTAYEAMPPGVDAAPIEGLKAVYAKTGISGKDVIIGYINKNQISKPGEHKIYATDSQGQEKRYIHLKSDNTIEFGGTGNFLVKYNELKTAFDLLKTELNAHIIAYNTHTHVVAGAVPLAPPTAPVTVPPLPLALAATADVSGAKQADFKTF